MERAHFILPNSVLALPFQRASAGLRNVSCCRILANFFPISPTPTLLRGGARFETWPLLSFASGSFQRRSPTLIHNSKSQVRRRPEGLTIYRPMRWQLTFRQTAVADRRTREFRFSGGTQWSEFFTHCQILN